MKTYEDGYTDGYNTYMKALSEKKKHMKPIPSGGQYDKAYLEGFRVGWNDARNEMTP